MSSRYQDQKPEQYEEKIGPSWLKAFAIILSIVLAVVVAGGIAVYCMGHSFINLSNYLADDDVHLTSVEELPEEAVETVATEESIGTTVNEEELKEIHQQMAVVKPKKEKKTEKNVFNILLVGVDRRDKSWNGNSDSMMLVSINYDDERVSVVSLMRDTYVEIENVGYNKLNNAYARGGGPLLTSTISNAFGVDVSRYAAVDFEDMIKIVDAMGGVDLELTEAEISVSNGYMMDMCNTLGLNGDNYILPLATGMYHCNGVQAVAYARNRFVGNSDYARTERQRYVIAQMVERVKNMNAAELTSFVTSVLPLVTHNVKEADIWQLVSNAPALLGYTYLTDRIPYDGHYEVIYVDQQDMLVPDWEYTVNQLHETIYGTGSISDNSDNHQEDRNTGYNDYSTDFQEALKTGTLEEDDPVYYGEGE